MIPNKITQQTLFKVRDKRNKNWFWVENDYFNGFGKILGIYAIGVYVSLCRHSNNEQKCFPSQKTIAEELKIGTRKVRDIIKDFEKYRIVEITKERSSTGKWLNNVYWLLDKSEWAYPEALHAYGNPGAPQDTTIGTTEQNHRHHMPTNNTNKNNTNKKIGETSATSPKSPHQEIIDFYYEAYKQQEGVSYVVSGGDGKAVKEALTTKQMSPQEIKSLLRWYLERPDFKKFPTMKTALSGHFINLYRQSESELDE